VRTTCPESLHSCALAGDRTRDLLIASIYDALYRCATTPPGQVRSGQVRYWSLTSLNITQMISDSHCRVYYEINLHIIYRQGLLLILCYFITLCNLEKINVNLYRYQPRNITIFYPERKLLLCCAERIISNVGAKFSGPRHQVRSGQVRYWSLTSLNITQMISDNHCGVYY